MKNTTRTAPAIAMVLLATAVMCLPMASGAATIVVDSGPFGTIREAAFGEANVNWNDADKSDDNACTEAFAALELQAYLRRITGRDHDFNVVAGSLAPKAMGDIIVVGGLDANPVSARVAAAMGIAEDAVAALGPEGYVIKAGQAEGRNALLIAGGGRVGTLYGVYDFLYRKGCRWFAPGDIHEETPPLQGSVFDAIDVSETPDHFMRGFHAWEKRGNRDFILWMARNRLNYWCVEEDDHPRLHKLGIKMVWGGHVVGFDYLKPNDPYPYAHAKFDAGKELPNDPYPVSETFLGDENKDGVLSYREAHPEWYGMGPDGKRVNVLRNGSLNYCTSNPDATAELMKNAVQQLIDGEAKDATIVNCWSVDGGKWCHCDACEAVGTPTDRNLRFVHAFDQEVKKAQAAGLINRPITLLFLAYYDVLEPPTKPLPDTFDYDTCIATYFPIIRCYVHDFDDPVCPKNASYARHLQGWAVDPKRFYKGQICIGEYYNVSGYKCLPICFMHTMENDIPFYHKEMNARYFHYMHVTTGNWGNKALTNYQMARQVWDVDTDCDALWKDYFAGRYGSAAGEMRKFYESLEQMFANVSVLKYNLCGKLSSGANPLFTDKHLPAEPAKDALGPSMKEIVEASAVCRAAIDGVLEKTLPARVAARVAEDEKMFTYGESTIAFYDALARAFTSARAGDNGTARKAFQEATGLAALLEADTVSASMSSSHANAPNALNASRAGGALAQLADILGPLDPEDVKRLDLSKGPAVLRGDDFQGGGAVLHGYHLHVFPGRIKVSDHGNYVYGSKAAPHDKMTAWFQLEGAPTGACTMTLAGLRCPEPPGSAIPGRVTVNDTVVFEGDMDFAEDEVTEFQCEAPAQAFKEGLNKIQVRNMTPGGVRSGRPWFGIDRVELKTK